MFAADAFMVLLLVCIWCFDQVLCVQAEFNLFHCAEGAFNDALLISVCDTLHETAF